MQRVQRSLGSYRGRLCCPSKTRRNLATELSKREIIGRSITRRSHWCCSKADNDDETEKENVTFSGPLQGLERTIEEMLLESPAVKSAIAKISAASQRYEESLRKRDELLKQTELTEKQRAEMEQLLEHRIMARAEVEAARKRMKAAELRMRAAEEEKSTLLQMSARNADRLESVKSFTASAVGGILAVLPLLLVDSGNFQQDAFKLVTTVFSSGLYGITYRYAIGDGRNVQLKIGSVSAFWIVSSLGILQSAVGSVSDPLTHFDVRLWNGLGLQSIQLLIVFLASTLAMELSFRSRFIQYVNMADPS